MNKAIIALIFTLILAVFTLIFVRTSCVDFVESYEVGYMFNRMNGHTHVVRRTGYVFHAPFVVDVNTVDLRPMQVCINANSRVLNCKLVQFNKDGIELFLSWHGRQNYSEMDLSEILKAYAYEGTGRSYPFLTVLREPRNRQAGCPRLGIRFARRVSFRIAFIRSGWQDLSMGSTELPDTGEPSMTADFGRIETCSCCGRDVKRPVFSKRLGAHFGRACMDSILATRQAYQFGGLMAATREAMTYKPRTWQTHLAYAIA